MTTLPPTTSDRSRSLSSQSSSSSSSSVVVVAGGRVTASGCLLCHFDDSLDGDKNKEIQTLVLPRRLIAKCHLKKGDSVVTLGLRDLQFPKDDLRFSQELVEALLEADEEDEGVVVTREVESTTSSMHNMAAAVEEREDENFDTTAAAAAAARDDDDDEIWRQSEIVRKDFSLPTAPSSSSSKQKKGEQDSNKINNGKKCSSCNNNSLEQKVKKGKGEAAGNFEIDGSGNSRPDNSGAAALTVGVGIDYGASSSSSSPNSEMEFLPESGGGDTTVSILRRLEICKDVFGDNILQQQQHQPQASTEAVTPSGSNNEPETTLPACSIENSHRTTSSSGAYAIYPDSERETTRRPELGGASEEEGSDYYSGFFASEEEPLEAAPPPALPEVELEARLVHEYDTDDDTEIVEAEPLRRSSKVVGAYCGGILVLVVVLLVSLLLVARRPSDNTYYQERWSVAPSMAPTMSPTANPLPMLQRIQQRGVLNCGYVSFRPLAQKIDVNTSGSIQVDICKAVAAAILGQSSYRVEFIQMSQTNFHHFLANGTIDLLPAWPTQTMQADVYEEEAGVGFSFVTPYQYDGKVFGGLEKYTKCGDDNIKTFFECSDISICLYLYSHEGGDSGKEVMSSIPGRNLVWCNNTFDVVETFVEGGCNVMFNANVLLAEAHVRALGYQGEDYLRGERFYSRDEHGAAVRDDDPEFYDFVNAVIMSLLAADLRNITSANAKDFGQTDLFGPKYKDMFMDAISVASNYADIYEEVIAPLYPRQGWNLINDGSTGLLAESTYTGAATKGPGPTAGGTLEKVLNRGTLTCVVPTDRLGFAHYTNSSGYGYYTPLSNSTYFLGGLDVEYCRAIAASLFEGDVSVSISIIEVSNRTDGFRLLSSGEADVYAGASWTLENDIREPSTGDGFSFSPPYFYRPLGYQSDDRFGDNLCLATRQTDPQWSSYVQWVASSLVTAEVNGISQRQANEMIIVSLFGERLQRMFRDAIHAVGNHGEIYERTVERFIPRKDRNLINRNDNPGPQHYVPPGFPEFSF